MSPNTDTATAEIDAILYSRVSTDEQAESGHGLADQRARLDGMAAAKGWANTVALVDDGVSAKTLNRPAMTEALALLAAGEAGALFVTNSIGSRGRCPILPTSWRQPNVKVGRSSSLISVSTPRGVLKSVELDAEMAHLLDTNVLVN